jgi:hypothetical protein
MLPYLPCFGVRLFVGTISLVVLTSFVSVLRVPMVVANVVHTPTAIFLLQ